MLDVEGSALGFSFVVNCADSAEHRLVARLLAGLADSLVATPRTPLVVDDDDDGFGRLINTVNHAAIATAEGQLLFHAGAVSGLDGGAAILCGPSGSGKSTLTAALSALDLAYVTDETVCIEPRRMRVRPFRKPLSLKPGSESALPHLRAVLHGDHAVMSGGSWLLAPHELVNAPAPVRDLWPKLLVFPTYRRGSSLVVEPVRPAQAAFMLGENSSRLRQALPTPLDGLARLARRTPAFRVSHGDVGSAADLVAKMLAAA